MSKTEHLQSAGHLHASEKLQAAHERLVRSVEALVSGEDWRAMLEVAQRFHTYSAANVLLIAAQHPEATRVAGYGTWKRLGRYVRKGEHGIAILAPLLYRAAAREGESGGGTGATFAEAGPSGASSSGARPVDAGSAAVPTSRERAGGEKVLRGFRVVHVFDVSQTAGEDLPEVRPAQLSGLAPDALFDALAAELARSGYTLLRADCSPANGKTHFLSRTVVVRPDLSPAQALKTLAHEVAHTMLHDGSEYGAGCRGAAEVEAESVAYLVCGAVGLRSDVYSFPYVARWAEGNLEVVQTCATRLVSCARRLTDTIEADLGIEVPTELVGAESA